MHKIDFIEPPAVASFPAPRLLRAVCGRQPGFPMSLGLVFWLQMLSTLHLSLIELLQAYCCGSIAGLHKAYMDLVKSKGSAYLAITGCGVHVLRKRKCESQKQPGAGCTSSIWQAPSKSEPLVHAMLLQSLNLGSKRLNLVRTHFAWF